MSTVRVHRRGALVATVMVGVLALAGCVKDSGNRAETSSGGGQPGNCVTAQKPEPARPTPPSETAQQGAKGDASKLRVGLAFDVGGRGDASFNDAAVAGVDKAKAELGLAGSSESTAVETEDEAAKQQRLRQLAVQGHNPVIAVGYSYADSVQAVATQFPATKFAIVDDDSVQAPNVTPLVFAEEQASFLVGVAAVYKSKSCHLGFIGGVDTPLIQKFEAGFQQGVKAASNKAKLEDEYLTPAGDNSGYNAPSKANAKAKAQIDNKDVDVLYHAAGKSGQGVFEAAKAGNAQAIGVDSDQYQERTLAGVKDVIMTSMIKRVDIAVYEYIRAVAAGDLSTVPARFDLEQNGVGYSTSGGKVDDITEVLDGYKQEIIDGKIKVSDKPED